MRASCTCTSFQVLKFLHFSSFEDTECISWDKAKETLLRLATTPPPPTARICFLMEYEGFLIGVGSRNDRWLMLMYKDLPGLQVVVHSIPIHPLLRTLSTLCYFPMKPKRAEFGQLRLQLQLLQNLKTNMNFECSKIFFEVPKTEFGQFCPFLNVWRNLNIQI